METDRRDGKRNFGKVDKQWSVPLPNLLDVQLESFRAFLQADQTPDERATEGLQEVFSSVFPISDPREMYSLEFVSYEIGEPKHSVEECQERDLTYSAPLKATLRLRIREIVDGEKQDKEIVEQEVYLGELPLITDKGTFIINGAERVIVSQLHRSPGVFFDETIHANGKKLFSARIIPYRGSWVEFSLDVNDVMYVHIDRKRKLPVTVLLRALGFQTEKEILQLFYPVIEVEVPRAGTKRAEELIGKIVADDFVDEETGEILLECNEEITTVALADVRKAKMKRAKKRRIKYFDIPFLSEADLIRNTLKKDACRSEEDALARIYNLLRPGDPPRADTAREILNRLFFNPRRYDLARVGRYKLNQKLDHMSLFGGRERAKELGLRNPSRTRTILCKEDFIAIIRYLLKMRESEESGEPMAPDDIDHLGNRRVRSVGELLGNQFNIGLARMARIIRERMALQDAENVTPYDLINARTISAVIQSFFGSSQLSQFMDQTNPLAELTHKRRLSALGPGGLTRDRAGFEVRDVHYTHYGRMCPIETPEGPNIGLISSLGSYARVNEFGFLETPYWKVTGGVVDRNKIQYLSADEEDKYRIAQANTPVRPDGKLTEDTVQVRFRGEFPVVSPDQVEYMDISPIQLVSPAAALIPFLEHDDANRALMGSNMQRQAVPLLKTETPLVETGLEAKVAEDSGALVFAKRAGVIESVSADTIIVRPEADGDEVIDFTELGGLDVYRLTKFKRSNQDTCINQKPLVVEEQKVTAGQVLADGPATKDGELALGANVLVAFMPWGGYNFEDAILVSERLITEDRYTSIHIEEFELQVRDTKRGTEEITREIPNVSEEAVRDLDEDGIVRIGAHVRAGDILVGKVTPKGETDLTPEERLLRAIFGEKAGDVRDASLKAPPGMDGIVIDIKVFSRKEKDEVTKKQEKRESDRLRRMARKERERVHQIRDEALSKILSGKTIQQIRRESTGRVMFHGGKKFSPAVLSKLELDDVPWGARIVKDYETNGRFWQTMTAAEKAIEKLNKELAKKLERISRGDELAPGVVKLVKVYVARKRKLAVGDKIAGRHGNKGVVAKILPQEDMPYLADGTPIEIVLNPLGVPSRMNLGQVLETHLGLAAKALGLKAISPIFAGATIEEIKTMLEEASLSRGGKSEVYDGRTGKLFDQPITVGYIYMMKLSHLVDDKIHARSIGPYSLVTQQPLGGKAQFGGQRFGEMEVWALEAYGAAYTLQELLTVKSDDVNGRSKIYEAIVKGENPSEPGVPESFNVLVKELQSLCLDVQFEEG
ncbi:MAG: DNA-directed RNA polymerase subunit beta [Latescibacteria bacterium DG_63]|nr:MAG: DNA-directed RNA polymerase subunit beta [Latescibacteria bacterium DG_63]